MKSFDEIDSEDYSSDIIDAMLSMITPESQAQTHYRMALAAKIADGLKAKGWKNLDLANAMKLKSPSLVSKWLSGTHNFTVDTLVSIQITLGIQLLDIKEEDSPNATIPSQPNPPVAPVELAKEIHSIKKNLTAKTKNNNRSFTTVNYK